VYCTVFVLIVRLLPSPVDYCNIFFLILILYN
jgi:hypothetical protein